MPFPPHLRRGLIASVLVVAAFSSAAITLGRSRGVALIGRPLDVAIAVTLDSQGQAGDLCPQAEVFQGDTRVEATRVSVGVDSAGGLEGVVRVRSSQIVDEPVVTIYLRVGCNQRITRRYVLLAEQPGELASPPAALLPAAPVAPPAASPAASPAAQTPARRAPDSAAPTTPAAARSARPVTRSSRATETAPMAPRGALAGRAEREIAAVGQPRRPAAMSPSRLRLDLLELQPQRDPRLHFAPGLTGQPSTDEQVRAQAAALWRSINAQPEDVLHDMRRMQALEADVKGLRTLVNGNDRSLADLRDQLDKTRQERTLTVGAIALLALLLAAIVVTWWLRRGQRAGQPDWWRRGDAALPAAAAAAGPAGPTGPKPAAPAVGRAAGPDLRVDESMFESLQPPQRTSPPRPPAPAVAAARPQAIAPKPSPPPPPAAQTGFQNSYSASLRMVKAEELVDIQQQADFFMSLGQTEQAIEVLETHIHDNVETSALVWLDLLAIYRSLKRREDYELLRTDFHRVFNAQVPSYDTTPPVSGGLEDYPRALSRIAALWPSPKVMDVIEESIFRKPGMVEGKPFDLEAYRELVMLYNLGREVVHAVGVPADEWTLHESGSSSFFQTSMQPLSAAKDSRGGPDSRAAADDDLPRVPAMASSNGALAGIADRPIDVDSMLMDEETPVTRLDEFPDPQMPRASPRLGLDIDLSGPAKLAKASGAADTGSVDFELSGPDDGARDTKPAEK